MFENLISKILKIEWEPIPNRQEIVTMPDVIYHPKDIETLRKKYGDAFKTSLCINLTLQKALSIMLRERRRRIDPCRGLQSYLMKEWDID